MKEKQTFNAHTLHPPVFHRYTILFSHRFFTNFFFFFFLSTDFSPMYFSPQILPRRFFTPYTFHPQSFHHICRSTYTSHACSTQLELVPRPFSAASLHLNLGMSHVESPSSVPNTKSKKNDKWVFPSALHAKTTKMFKHLQCEAHRSTSAVEVQHGSFPSSLHCEAHQLHPNPTEML